MTNSRHTWIIRRELALLREENALLSSIAEYAQCRDDCIAIANGPECTCGLDALTGKHLRLTEPS